MTGSTMKTVTLKIAGMTCGHCVARVQKALDATSGVRAAKVDLKTGTAEVQFDGAADPSTLIGVVEAAGYAAQAA